MARAQRTAELLAAAGLVDRDIAMAGNAARRDVATKQALAALLPELLQTGAGIAGDVAEYDLDKQALAAKTKNADRVADAREKDALDRIIDRQATREGRIETERSKSEAAAAKAKADADKQAREGQKTARADAVQQTRAGLAGDSKTRTGGLSRADLERQAAAVGMTPEQLLQDADLANLDEMNAAAKTKKALAPKPAKAGPSPEAIERQRVKDELAREQLAQLKDKPGDKAKADADAAAAAKAKGQRLTTGEATAVIEIKGAKKILDDLKTLKTGGDNGSPIDTGPIENAIGWAAKKIGSQSPEWTKFKATAGTQLAEYIKSISGATVGDKEREALLENVPTPSDDDEEFLAKLEAVQSILDTKLQTMRQGYRAAGRDTAIFDEGAEAEADAFFSND